MGLDFMGIGAQRAGTTWIFHQLNAHPDVHIPPEKELHFWNHTPRNTHSYLQRLHAPGRCSGEITPAYAMLETPVLRAIHSLAPALRVFYVARDPRARAWSAAVRAVARAEMDLDEASDAWFLDHIHSRGSRDRGRIVRTLDRFSSVFTPSQFLVLRYPELCANPASFLNRIWDHLGVSRRAPTGRFEPRSPPIPVVIRDELHRIYEHEMEAVNAHPLVWGSLDEPPR